MTLSSESTLKGCLKATRQTSLLVLTVISVSGCATISDITSLESVKPWQRGTLAGDEMQLVGDSLQQSVDDHIYFSKEASTGGSSVQGGGCGCN